MKYFYLWPPFATTGISVREFDLDKGYIVSQMKLSWWNANAFGTMFGGSLYAMCDPFYVFLLMHKLGREYYIWDIESNIKFLKATKKNVYARFEIHEAQIDNIKAQAASGIKVTPSFSTQILDADNQVIAEVSKKLYVKLKKKSKLEIQKT